MNAGKPEGTRLYLDVTSACQSALNTGVKRVQRGLHGWLSQLETYQPIYWQSALGSYRRLTPQDQSVLEQRNETSVQGFRLYDAFGTGYFSDWRQARKDRALTLPWPEQGRSGDIILVPDLLWDSRASYFRQLHASPMKKVGIFHDAIGLRRAWKSGVDALFCAKGVRALAAFDLVICISQEAEADLLYYWKKWGVKQTRTHVALWPIPFQGEQPPHQANFAARHLLYVARLEEHKNHLRLLEACEKLWEEGMSFQLSLIGCNAYPLYSWKVRRRIQALQTRGRQVELRPQVSEAELHQAYRNSSFTVFPSLLEGFGLPILESLWHGRPVICGVQGALGEVARGGGCEPIDPFDTGSLAAGIRKLLWEESSYHKCYQELQNRPFRTWKDYWGEVSVSMEKI
jgi:glycosyltransferase involved in cell wall biosynthesis